MLFNSYDFLLFYPIVTLIYYLLAHRFRWFWLLAASCYFYMFFVPIYILILAGTIVIDYFLGIKMENTPKEHRKKWLWISIAANVGILAVFKYYNFFAENANVLLSGLHLSFAVPYLTILLPVGLSFHTFQAMSYSFEIYRGNQKAERHFGIYALYVMFYPQLVAGPIERPQNILHQFHEKKTLIPKHVYDGLCLMLWGLFKKVVIADRVSEYVDAVYNNYENHSGASLILASVFFAIQIYCDFSGYSDIAIGTAKTMQFDLMKNFNRPYFARGISQFWSRWHISLSTWFRDYLYIPLGGNKVSRPRWYLNVFIVFMVSGFWHGANWTYIIWGFIHGVFNSLDHFVADVKKYVTKGVKTAFLKMIEHPLITIPVNFAIVTFAWIFFRAHTVEQSFAIVRKIFTDYNGKLFTKTGDFLIYSLTAILILFAKEFKDEYQINIKLLSSERPFVKVATASVLVIWILMAGVFHNTQFIYFQF